jgi:iron(III) transport system substrate-binding protein
VDRALSASARSASRPPRGLLGLLALLALVGAACGGDGRTVLTIYSPHGKELLDDYERRFEALHPTIDVQNVDMGAQEILDRARAERDNPQADVWFGATSDMFEHAAREGLLDAYVPSWASAVPAEARDAGNRWFGTYLTPEVIGYNSDKVSAADAPKDWDDVLDPKWKGRVLIRDPVASGSLRAIFGGILARSIAETGNTAKGWDWLRRLDANTKEYTLNAAILYQKLGRGEGVITLYNMPDIATLQDRTKIPVKAVIPSSGTPLVVDAIAVMHKPTDAADSSRARAARLYVDYVGAADVELAAAREHLRIPIRTDIPADSLPAWIRDARAEIRPMAIDRRLIADSLDVWMTYWDTHIRNRSRGR